MSKSWLKDEVFFDGRNYNYYEGKSLQVINDYLCNPDTCNIKLAKASLEDRLQRQQPGSRKALRTEEAIKQLNEKGYLDVGACFAAGYLRRKHNEVDK